MRPLALTRKGHASGTTCCDGYGPPRRVRTLPAQLLPRGQGSPSRGAGIRAPHRGDLDRLTDRYQTVETRGTSCCLRDANARVGKSTASMGPGPQDMAVPDPRGAVEGGPARGWHPTPGADLVGRPSPVRTVPDNDP